ncbi:FG-GAP-like repeat-containing protein [Botrimarina mediterranea]|uniref:FG-GAP repeat protein n=1 Tax=Botrimarina mediterranea TaxID=2528022 RepID=A0A518K9P3_9BACT|nr:FG-GAP-like repeat-containing protein [Botrimarina mediterranea]QDV74514.1 FG-GAP repeat protein [Botrimarina mediterranea]QDV79154.1 FG-GAP repeat protein [Planctomycetes bacterium K2D]
MKFVQHAASVAACLAAAVSTPLSVTAQQLSGDYLMDDADIAFLGTAYLGRVGFSVSSAGDFNGDGFDDFLFSAPNAPPNSQFSGETFLLYGGAETGNGQRTLSPMDADVHFVGIEGQHAGYRVSSAGDLNLDGLDDLLIATADFSERNKVYLVYGRPDANQLTGEFQLSDSDATFVLERSSDPGPVGLTPAGDIDGDGAADLLIGDYTYGSGYPGRAYLFYGNPDASLSGGIDIASADATFDVDFRDGTLGYSVSSAGDLNGDGLDDVAIGALGQGEVYLYYGRPTSERIAGRIGRGEADAVFSVYGAGRSLSTAGDLNGDGLNDLVIGASDMDYNGEESGAAYLLYGKAGDNAWRGEIDLDNADVRFEGVAEGDKAGYQVSSAGDVNGDGIDDLLIGAYQAQGDPNDYADGQQGGKTYLVYGRRGGVLDEAVYDLDNADAVFIGGYRDFIGSAVDSTGDLNGDGLADIVLGAHASDTVRLSEGAVYIFYGRPVPEPSAAVLTIAAAAAFSSTFRGKPVCQFSE